MTQQALNVLGTALVPCSFDPLTGFYRDGCCNTDLEDHGTHVVCAVISDEFLQFSKLCGNDLSTPRPEMRFRGVQPGERWCLHVLRFVEALKAGMAPDVVLEATHENVLRYVPLKALQQYAAD